MAATVVSLAVPYTTPTNIGRNGGIYTGNGDPDFTAPKGSLYVKLNASTTTTRLWINTDAGTTWTYFTSNA